MFTTFGRNRLLLCSNSFSGLLLAEGLVLIFAFEAHGMMIRSVNPNLQLEQSTTGIFGPGRSDSVEPDY
jgi:hypothetical protein